MWYQKSVEDTERHFRTDRNSGLTALEHDRRREHHGPNALEQKKQTSPAGLFFRQFADFMVMVLMAAAVVSAMLGERVDALMILAIIVMNSILGFIQEYKAEQSLGALKKLTEDEARVLIGGELAVKKAEELVVGDVVLLETGTKVPADLRLTESLRLRAEESILTGEAKDVAKTTAALSGDIPLAKRSNMCYSGTVITGGRGRGVVVATGMDTELGHIAKLLDHGKPELTPLQKQLKHLGKILILLCTVVCVIVAAAGFFMGGALYEMILTGVSLGVASIPEGLPIVVTICLALGVRRLTAVHAIVRRLPAVETLGCVTCICTDKTGTLTKSRMETQFFYGNGRWYPAAEFGSAGKLAEDVNLVIGNCNSLYREGDRYFGDATEVALMIGAERNGAPVEKLSRTDEIAFDSDRKMMSVAVTFRGHTMSLVKGAPDRIVDRCRYISIEGKELPLGYEEKNLLRRAVAAYSADGYRILALALRRQIAAAEDMETELTFLAFAAISDPLREDAASSLARAAAAGVRSIMITGDQKGTALAIGRKLGIAEEEADAVTGSEVQKLSDGELSTRLEKVSVIAAASPADKMRVVSVLRSKGEICAMTGDGVNDAPALKKADIGIAMGQKGTDVTKEAADFILADDNFSSIVEAIYQGRGIYDNIRKFIRYLLSSNLGEILVMFLGVVLSFPLPLLPLQILWINLVTDGFPALALAMEPPRASLLQEPPRKAGGSVFSGGLGRKIALRGVAIGVLCFSAFFLGIYLSEDIAVARTMAFNALVLSQLFYVFDCRSEHGLLKGKDWFSNPFLLITVAVSLLLQWIVVYHSFFNALFHTVALSSTNLLLSIALAALPSAFSAVISVISQKKSEKF